MLIKFRLKTHAIERFHRLFSGKPAGVAELMCAVQRGMRHRLRVKKQLYFPCVFKADKIAHLFFQDGKILTPRAKTQVLLKTERPDDELKFMLAIQHGFAEYRAFTE